MTPGLIKDNDRARYEGKSDHDLIVELRVKVDYLEEALNKHCSDQAEASRFNITTVMAVIALMVSAVALLIK